MPEPLDSALNAEKNVLHTSESWAWLIEVELDGSDTLRITNHDSALTAQVYTSDPSDSVSVTFQPFPVTVATVPRDAGGSLPEVEIRLGNYTREIAEYVEGDKFLDQTVRLRLATTVEGSTLANYTNVATFRILGVTVSMQEAAFRIGRPNLFRSPFPNQRYGRLRCRFIYGGNACGFDRDNTYTNTPASYPNFDATTCDLGLDTENGCRAHGAAQAANGLAQKHPRRFGGFPSIPAGPQRSA